MNPIAPASPIWHTIIDIQGQPYPTRNYADDIDGDSTVCLDLSPAQLDYLRAIHEAGHAICVLLANGHLHSAEIVHGKAVGNVGGSVQACNLADGPGYAAYSAAGERAGDRWLREAGLWTPQRAVANEVGARDDRRQFLEINPHVGFGDRHVDYRIVHDLADQALDQHWADVTRMADQLVGKGRLDASEIVAITGLPNGAASTACPLRPAATWDDDSRTTARYDDRYWDNLYDRDED